MAQTGKEIWEKDNKESMALHGLSLWLERRGVFFLLTGFY